MPIRRYISGLILAAVLTGPTPAANGENPRSETFHGETSVLVVEVPVRVLVDGAPMRGLTRDDFEIHDRGQRREIIAFEVLERGPWLGEPDGFPVARAFPAEMPPRTYLLLFDFAYSSSQGLAKALAASRHLVEEEMRGEDQVAVAFFSALRGFRLLVSFTADRSTVEGALDVFAAMLARDPESAGRLHDRLASGLVRAAVPAAPLAAPLAAPTLGPAPRAQPSAPPLATRQEVVDEAGILVRADPYWPHRSVVRGLARALVEVPAWAGEVPSPRDLLYLSQGFPSKVIGGKGSAGTLGELERVFRGLRQSGWAVQAINVDSYRARGGIDSLFLLAHETGGESFENFNDLDEAFDLMLHRTTVTYLLAFQPDNLKADETFHRLRIRLTNGPAGARLVYRPGYYAPRPAPSRLTTPPRIP